MILFNDDNNNADNFTSNFSTLDLYLTYYSSSGLIN